MCYFPCVLKDRSYMWGAVAQRLERWTINRENPGFESSYSHFKALAILFIPHCHSSLSCINEYLATDRGGYLN